jgi:hypothetical protein
MGWPLFDTDPTTAIEHDDDLASGNNRTNLVIPL